MNDYPFIFSHRNDGIKHALGVESVRSDMERLLKLGHSGIIVQLIESFLGRPIDKMIQLPLVSGMHIDILRFGR